MRRFLKNRIVLGVACIVASLAICFGLTPLFNDALTATVTIVRVNAEIKQGEQITARMVTTVEVGGYNLPVKLSISVDTFFTRILIPKLQSQEIHNISAA